MIIENISTIDKATTGMKDSSPDEESLNFEIEMAEATMETLSQESHPMTTKGTHKVVAKLIEVNAEVEEENEKNPTKDLEVTDSTINKAVFTIKEP